MNKKKVCQTREDLYVYEEIINNGYLNKLNYNDFLNLCIKFTINMVLLPNNLDCYIKDLEYAVNFLNKVISEDELLRYQDLAWHNYRKLKKENMDLEEKIQRLTIIFLYPKFLYGIEDDDMTDSNEFLFLHLIYQIQPNLCIQFLNFLREGENELS